MLPVGEVLFSFKEMRPFPKKTCLVIVEDDSLCDSIASVEHSTLSPLALSLHVLLHMSHKLLHRATSGFRALSHGSHK